jgi:hypothetical protein
MTEKKEEEDRRRSRRKIRKNSGYSVCPSDVCNATRWCTHFARTNYIVTGITAQKDDAQKKLILKKNHACCEENHIH